jgi:hypothetical protein
MSESTAERVRAWLVEQLGAELTLEQVALLGLAFGESHDPETEMSRMELGVSNERSKRGVSRYGLVPSGAFVPDPKMEVLYARALVGPGACPTCYLLGGFHDHGEAYSRHDAHQVPRHLVRLSNSAARRQRRAEQRATC